MSADYDSPASDMDKEIETDSLEGLKAAEDSEKQVEDTDDGDIVEALELPMMEISGEELSGSVIPRQKDEFICDVCFLVQHRSRIGYQDDKETICVDCV